MELRPLTLSLIWTKILSKILMAKSGFALINIELNSRNILKSAFVHRRLIRNLVIFSLKIILSSWDIVVVEGLYWFSEPCLAFGCTTHYG